MSNIKLYIFKFISLRTSGSLYFSNENVVFICLYVSTLLVVWKYKVPSARLWFRYKRMGIKLKSALWVFIDKYFSFTVKYVTDLNIFWVKDIVKIVLHWRRWLERDVLIISWILLWGGSMMMFSIKTFVIFMFFFISVWNISMSYLSM